LTDSFRCGSAPDSASGAYSAPPQPHSRSCIKGALLLRIYGGMGEEEKVRNGEEVKGERKERGGGGWKGEGGKEERGR